MALSQGPYKPNFSQLFTLFHFAFQVVKIAIQSVFYSSIILFLIFVITKVTGLKMLTKLRFRGIYFTTAGLFFLFSFTYYGNHGLGDQSNLPLGYGKVMRAGDGYAHFYLEPRNQISVDSFLVKKDHLYFTSNGSYYDYHLSSGKWQKYDNKQGLDDHLSVRNLAKVDKLETFYPQYDRYWNGWRFWFLP
jgi:hypothetical protein